jgi:hypothetical protein
VAAFAAMTTMWGDAQSQSLSMQFILKTIVMAAPKEHKLRRPPTTNQKLDVIQNAIASAVRKNER